MYYLCYCFIVFGMRLTLLQRAVANGRSVCLSVCLSVTLVSYATSFKLSKHFSHHMIERCF